MKNLAGILLILALCVLILPSSVQAPAQSNAATVQPDPVVEADRGNPNVKVWVNTASGVYHCPGTRWYGTTKRGEYMTQAEAQKKRYRPAYGKVCQ